MMLSEIYESERTYLSIVFILQHIHALNNTATQSTDKKHKRIIRLLPTRIDKCRLFRNVWNNFVTK